MKSVIVIAAAFFAASTMVAVAGDHGYRHNRHRHYTPRSAYGEVYVVRPIHPVVDPIHDRDNCTRVAFPQCGDAGF